MKNNLQDNLDLVKLSLHQAFKDYTKLILPEKNKTKQNRKPKYRTVCMKLHVNPSNSC